MSERVVILAPSAWSFGELANAMVLAGQLAPFWNVEVMVSSRFVEVVRAAGVRAWVVPRGRAAAAAVREVCRSADVAAVVVADHHLFGLERVGFGYEDLRGARRVLVCDSLAFGPAGAVLRNAAAAHEQNPVLKRWFPERTEIEPVPEGVPVLRPVPVSGTTALVSGREVYPFDLYGGSLRAAGLTAQTRARFGIEPGRALVVVASAGWAAMAGTVPGLGGPNPLRDAVSHLRFEWMCEVLRRVGRPVALLGVGWSVGAAGPAVPAEVQVVSTGMLPSGEFSELLEAADLFVTDNLTSGAMARAALLGTPVLALTNERQQIDATEFGGRWRERYAQVAPGFLTPFLVNPFGWIDELIPLQRDNPYLAAVPRAEAFCLDEQVAAFSRLLSRTSGEIPESGRALRAMCAELPDAPTVLRHLTG